MLLKLSAKRLLNKSLLALLLASIIAIVAALLLLVGSIIAALACESRSCNLNISITKDAYENSVACKALAIALQGEGQQGS
jgi:hypothetical protein